MANELDIDGLVDTITKTYQLGDSACEFLKEFSGHYTAHAFENEQFREWYKEYRRMVFSQTSDLFEFLRSVPTLPLTIDKGEFVRIFANTQYATEGFDEFFERLDYLASNSDTVKLYNEIPNPPFKRSKLSGHILCRLALYEQQTLHESQIVHTI